MEKVRGGKRTEVEVGESGERSPTALTYTNVTYFHELKLLSRPQNLAHEQYSRYTLRPWDSFRRAVVSEAALGKWRVDHARRGGRVRPGGVRWRPHAGSGAWITPWRPQWRQPIGTGGGGGRTRVRSDGSPAGE